MNTGIIYTPGRKIKFSNCPEYAVRINHGEKKDELSLRTLNCT